MRPPSSFLARNLYSAAARSTRLRPNPHQPQSPLHNVTRPAPMCPHAHSFAISLPRSSLPPSNPPLTTDRGPTSKEDTQTDFSAMNVLANTPPPTTAIDACLSDGFHLDNGVKITGGSGCLLIAGEAFSWRPWDASPSSAPSPKTSPHGAFTEAAPTNTRPKGTMINKKGQWDVDPSAWGILDVVWPKPDLLILGLGKDVRPLSPETRNWINGLGIRVDVQDTRNAAAEFNLLATERGTNSVAAALVPLGWREPK